ncbi:PDF receptor-like isoform X2 [Babylonia areolata]|uniref:PDF receptor-like isoform X2 n=1 Tax=Babylonia areolata TaxID=304850 RepID=UPI003FD1BDFA
MTAAGNNSAPPKPSGEQQCFARLGPQATLDTEVYCNATWDTVLCWPATLPNQTIWLPCPALHGLDTSKYAYRHCGPDGIWQGREPGDYSKPSGYSFYASCYTSATKGLMEKYRHLQHIKEVTGNARILEIVGLSVSLVSTILSLVIFCYFRSLRCHRTRIHKNLFVAIIVQITMRILMVVDQYIARKTGGEVAGASSGSSGALYDTPIFCEMLYALLEYTKTVKFMWMFVEGLYLHNMIAVAFFNGKPNYLLFYSLGWGFPVLVLTAWVVPMTQHFKVKCWFAYYYTPLIWILEGPRAAVMAVNLGFLLNIIRVLVMKLRESHTNEAKRVRKAVKAAIILLPLLGLTNFVIMLEPAGDDIILFSVWIFSGHFLTDFEGFFISLIYCFLNGEVQSAVRLHLFRHMPSSYSMDLSASHWRKNTVKKAGGSPAAMNTELNGNGQPELMNGTGNGASTNGQVSIPLLKLASRRFNSLRRTSAKEVSRSRWRVTDAVKTDSMQEEEI